MSLLFRLLSLFSPGLNFIWIKKTMWTGAEFEMSCSVLLKEYCSTSTKVLEYSLCSTGVLLRKYWENDFSAEIGDLQESCLNAERTDSTCRGDSPFLYLKSCCLIE